MTEVSPALCTHRLDPHHAVAAVGDLADRAGQGLRKTGPATARVEFGARIKQQLVTADAAVAAIGPDLLVFASERAFRCGLARDLEGTRLGPFLREQRLPLGVGFFDGIGQEEQLISMEDAQSGARPA